MRALGRALLVVVAALAAGNALACTNPAGVAGRVIYNSAVNALQFCDGTNWVNLNQVSPTAPNTGCTNPVGSRGLTIFNAAQKTHQVCNGSQWADLSCGAAVSAGSACSNPTGTPGQIIHAVVSGTNALWSCGGGSWARMGLPCAGGLASPNISQLFATTLYTGNGAAGRAVTTGIDLANRGGVAWFKPRSLGGYPHLLVDTARGPNNWLQTNGTNTSINDGSVSAFGATGITISGLPGYINTPGATEVVWSFARAPRFFDVVTWTGNGVTNRQISHNIGVAPGLIVVKRTDASAAWIVWHRSSPLDGANRQIVGTLNTSDAINQANEIQRAKILNVTTTTFEVLGDASNAVETNLSGGSYVAYIFAHDNAVDGVIKCDSFTATGLSQNVPLSWQPQWLLVKEASTSGNWAIRDTVRGFGAGDDAVLFPNLSNAEALGDWGTVTTTGFTVNTGQYLNGTIVVYCAIRAP